MNATKEIAVKEQMTEETNANKDGSETHVDKKATENVASEKKISDMGLLVMTPK